MLGDSLYAPAEAQALSPRLLLHARDLGFPHPFTEKPMAFSLPVDWSAQPPYLGPST
jgi:tRNA pseudouridine32 synthase/23S rRNA pseudouridine746 synthase